MSATILVLAGAVSIVGAFLGTIAAFVVIGRVIKRRDKDEHQ